MFHVIERYRLIDGKTAAETETGHERTYFPPGALINASPRGDIDTNTTKKGLQVEVTVEDPNIFTTPWKEILPAGAPKENGPKRSALKILTHIMEGTQRFRSRQARIFELIFRC